MLGPISLEPGKDGSLWANYRFNAGVLIKAAGTNGSGGRSWYLFAAYPARCHAPQ
jgi:hypothetical protein